MNSGTLRTGGQRMDDLGTLPGTKPITHSRPPLHPAAGWILIVLLVSPVLVLADAPTWTTHGPEGGLLVQVAVDPLNGQTCYAATAKGGVFKSTDGGQHWFASSTGLLNLSVTMLAIDPTDSALLYATTNSGCHRSTDGGATWSYRSSGLTNTSTRAVLIHPQTPSTLYLATMGGVFRSTDGGNNWFPASAGLSDIYVYSLAIDPWQPSVLYAGTMTQKVFKTTDGGGSWLPANSGLPARTIDVLLADPFIPDTVYAGCDQGLYKSTDAGNNWTASHAGIPSPHINGLITDPLLAGTLYSAVSAGGVYRTTDGGGTWTSMSTGLSNLNLNGIAIDPADPDILYAPTNGGGLFRSTDTGNTWAAANAGLIATQVNALAADPRDAGRIYAGVKQGGVVQSTDGGQSWSDKNSGLTSSSVNCLSVHPQQPDIILAGTDHGLYRSTDGGESWKTSSSGTSGSTVLDLAFDPVQPATVYAAYSAGIFKSTDTGANWTACGPGLSGDFFTSIVMDPSDAQTLYVGESGAGVFRSTDAGATWTPASSGLPDLRIKDLAIDPESGGTLFTSVYPGTVYASTDGGGSWTARGTGLLGANIQTLILDPDIPGRLFGGGLAVYQSTDEGANWSRLESDGTVTPVTLALLYRPEGGGTLYAGTDGGGVSVSHPNPCSAPEITEQPRSDYANSGQTIALSVTVTGTAPFTYRWYRGQSDDTSQLLSESAVPGFTTPPITETTSFWVRVSNSCGEVDSQAAIITLLAAPAAPSDLEAETVSATQIQLNWQDNATNDVGVSVERKSGGGEFSPVVTLTDQATTWQDGGLTPNTSYTYRLRAFNLQGYSDYTGEATATTLSANAPAAPEGLTATVLSPTEIWLTWQDKSTNETGFRVERQSSAKAWTPLALLGVGETHYRDSTTATDQVYLYRICATSLQGDSAYSNLAGANTTSALPAAPAYLTATAYGGSSILLLWEDNSDNESGFRVERRTGTGGTWSQIALVGANGRLYADTGLPAATNFFYRVRAGNAAGNSAYSNVDSANTSDFDLFIPASAHTLGVNNTLWRTDVDLVNPGASAGVVVLALFVKDQANSNPLTSNQAVPAGRAIRLDDVLGGTPFNTSNAALGIRLGSVPIQVNSRFYNTASACGGTYGMYIDSVGPGNVIPGNDGVTLGLFHHLSYDPTGASGFRTNLGFVNATGFDVQVLIRLYGDSGEFLGSHSHTLLPFEHRQFTRIHEMLHTPAVTRGYATVEVLTPGGKVHPYAMLIDNVSGDPVYMPVKRLER